MMGKEHVIRLSYVFIWLVCCLCTTVGAQPIGAPDLFSYEELTELYNQKTLSQPLEGKLSRLLTTPFVDNSLQISASLQLSKSRQLGEFLRVAHWNIEHGLEYEALEAVFTGEDKFTNMLSKEKYPVGSTERRELLEQASALRAADVIVLNEVDWGNKRTDYRNIAAILAARLGMNYAFGVQFIELSPVHFSQEPAHADAGENEILKLIKVDPNRYKGLHGIAILSRFPLENVRLMPFRHQPYDWYESEKKSVSIVERGKRAVSKKVFLEKTLREVRRGGRTMLLADIADARFPSGRVTIVATHLENRTKPVGRVKQLRELLGRIKQIPHPVVVAGDMNTSTEDLTPTSLRRELKKRFGNPRFGIQEGIGYLLGFGLLEDVAVTTLTFGRKHADPTVRHIPFFAANPGRKFFTVLEKFRFEDGGAFDFRGDPVRSTGKKARTLSNSNERGNKGFITTYQVKRPILFVGKYKLDWIFVKPAHFNKLMDRNASYRFAPHFGRTLTAVNEIVDDRVSDHRPMLVDLPLDEPPVD